VTPLPFREPADILRIAHRGADAAEKYDLDDLRRVATDGAHLVELDLHVTGDDRLVVRHNPMLYIDGTPIWLADYALADLLPSLKRASTLVVDDVIRAAKQVGLGLYVDIKSITASAVERLVSDLEAEGMAERTILGSVRSDVVRLCADVAPCIPRAVLFASTLEEPVQLADAIQASYVHPCWERVERPDKLLAGPWLERVRAYGLGVICWHEERPHVIRGLYDLGIDGICTDEPRLLTQTASERGDPEANH
jgi:glycerophosphoryl diester phosphodiesterase